MKISVLCRKAVRFKGKVGHPFCTAVIVAAGSASRMGGIDKIMTPLCGEAVICHSIRAFENSVMTDEIIVVTTRDKLEAVSKLCSPFQKVRLVCVGGETRVLSVMSGIRAASEKTELFAVHDGARPLVTPELIDETVRCAASYSAAAPAVPVKDTVKLASGGKVLETPDRRKLFAVQTPQVFDRDLLLGALTEAIQNRRMITDDCSAVEAIGMVVHLTKGSEENIKITTPLDLELAKLIFQRRKLTCGSDTDTTCIVSRQEDR